MIQFEQNEKVIIEIRKHWFIIFAEGAGIALLGLLPIFVIAVADTVFPEILKNIFPGDSQLVSTFFYSIWFLILWVFFFIRWTDYYLDVWVVTDRRLIDVDQKGFFHREIATLYFDKIQDITTSTRGIIATVLDFGDITIQTAGEKREFIMHSASKPEEIRELILKEHRRFESSDKNLSAIATEGHTG